MKMFHIEDGRTSFWQWDLNQRLILSDDRCCEVHFHNGTTEHALVCDVYEENGKRLVDVPNILLQSDKLLKVFTRVETGKEEYTEHSAIFSVTTRPKPSDYVYTETEVKNLDSLMHRMDSVEEATEQAVKAATRAENIARGRATGYVFDTAEDLELWLNDASNVAKLTIGDNLLIRQVDVPDYWWDGAQKQVLEAQKVDLSGYVKSTDYATKGGDIAGVISIPDVLKGNYGLIATDQSSIPGGVTLSRATNAEIDSKTQKFKPIVPANLDYAIKRGITHNTQPLTDKEKENARKWLGITASGDRKTVDDSTLSAESAWSSRHTVDTLCPTFTENGSVVACEPVEGYPLTVTTEDGATQITRCGKNLCAIDPIELPRDNGAVIWSGSTSKTMAIRGDFSLAQIDESKKGAAFISYEADGATKYISLDNVINGAKTVTGTITQMKIINWCDVKGTVKLELELGTKPTEYEPYQCETFAIGEPIPALQGVNTIYADAGLVTVTGKADPVAIIEKLTNAILSLGGNV